ncbi:MAG: hypothetical protein ACE5ES_01915 [Candidatus Nanoarchaeia archaeon]
MNYHQFLDRLFKDVEERIKNKEIGSAAQSLPKKHQGGVYSG